MARRGEAEAAGIEGGSAASQRPDPQRHAVAQDDELSRLVKYDEGRRHYCEPNREGRQMQICWIDVLVILFAACLATGHKGRCQAPPPSLLPIEDMFSVTGARLGNAL
jgi:hypothetical protein